jgi:tetratricopeptide (TPR) repeat protein
METQVKAALIVSFIGFIGVILSPMIPHWLEPTQPLGVISESHPSSTESKNVTIINQMPFLTSFVPKLKSPQVAGESIVWTATAEDPESDRLYYKFFQKGPSNVDLLPQTGWTTNNKWIWSTTEADIGKNEIQVCVKDDRHSVDPLKGDDSIIKSYTITQSATSLNTEGLALYYKNKYDDAIEAYDEAIRIDPNYVDSWTNKGNALLMQENYVDALKAYDKAISLDPNDFEAWNNKGIALKNQEKYADAIKAYDKAISLDPSDVVARVNKCTALINLDKYDEANKAIDEAIRLDSNLAESWVNKGNILFNLGEYDEAINACEKAIELNPQLSVAWSNKGSALKALGRTTEANAAISKAKELEDTVDQMRIKEA